MKIIFLDIDGVLNTWDYRRRLELEYFSNLIDRDKMIHLKKIVDLTGAKIVLSSSWRKYWNKSGEQIDSAGRNLQEVFREFDLQIYDKTPVVENSPRGEEIWAWLKGKYSVEEYVILDDRDYGWNRDLRMHFVQTDDAGDGLTDELADAAIRVLNGELLSVNESPTLEASPIKRKTLKQYLQRFFRDIV